MKQAGQVALLPFPYTDGRSAKLRPVLLLRKASTRYDDWLVCMISSRLHQAEPTLDEPVLAADADFRASGLKVPSLLRLSRLAVVDGALMAGAIGAVDEARLQRVRWRLAQWLAGVDVVPAR